MNTARTIAINQILIEETGLQLTQIKQTVVLLEGGATVPFIARYRKEATGELDEVEIRLVQERLEYHTALNERRQIILKSINEQGKLTPELRQKIEKTRQKTELEDLYLPFKPKRRTKALIAKERGLEPLAVQLLAARGQGASDEELARPFLNVEQEITRDLTWQKGLFSSQPARGKEETVSKFEMYYDFSEPLQQIPSHRMLAMRRGEKEEFLRLRIEAPEEEILGRLCVHFVPAESRFTELLREIIVDAYKRLLTPSIEVELRLQAKKAADDEAIRVFAENLRNLLLAAPAGSYKVLGVDPGLRTGSKLAVVDATGRFLEHVTIYPHTGGGAKIESARRELLRLIENHNIEMIAIGNGTAGREMDQFIRAVLKEAGLKLQVVMVSEAGASVYSASEIAREEFPDLDLTVRGAISIARRLQDPLAELVKVDPKSIGVGQYQHDVSQTALKKSLDEVVESCVNFVGVDLNTASWALLSFVSGISETLAKAIINHRDSEGAFIRRNQLLKVPRFGKKAYEQAAGFLRIRNAVQPLDNTAVHPERYGLVEKMATDLSVAIAKLIAEPALFNNIRLETYVGDDIGLPTLRDIVNELKKPGRDPRESFVTTSFREDVMEVKDLKEGMTLNGVVTNVAAFGAFVDIGVHQDGLVHVSQLADRFVKDPNQVVKVGQQVQVRVLSIDLQRKRIGLTMRKGEAEKPPQEKERFKQARPEKKAPESSTAMAEALSKSGFRVNKGKGSR
jgi:uncharacterized protein